MAEKTQEKDVVMSETSEAKKEAAASNAEASSLFLFDIKNHIALLEKLASTKELRYISRVLRQINTIRRKLTVPMLKELVEHYYPADAPQRELLLQQITKLSEAHMGDENSSATLGFTKERKPNSILPEVDVYISLLVLLKLLDKKLYDEACTFSTSLVDRLNDINRPTIFPLSARVYFYYARSFELTDRLSEIRSKLLSLHRTTTLRHDYDGRITTLNLLLRNYLEYDLYEQADKLVSKVSLNEANFSSSQDARYLYYQGRIKSIQLAYTQAYECLLTAIRKAPQKSARGFRITAYKLLCIVQLLMGEIPERNIFYQPGLQAALKPYFQLTQTVHIGDLTAFHSVVNTYSNVFIQDKNYSLIQRLRTNVIKTGLRKINLSYSRIHLKDVCAKLHLDSVEDAEFIVAKAIHDGVIDATIDHEGGFMQSKGNIDVYSTNKPLDDYHERVCFCLKTYNEAVKAMWFPPDAHKAHLESDEARRERQKQEQEIANHLAKDDDDDEF